MVKKTKENEKKKAPAASGGMDAMLSIKLPSELLEKARAKSKQTGVVLSFVVRKSIEEWVRE